MLNGSMKYSSKTLPLNRISGMTEKLIEREKNVKSCRIQAYLQRKWPDINIDNVRKLVFRLISGSKLTQKFL